MAKRTFTKYPSGYVKASRESDKRLGYGVEYRDMHSALHGILLATDKATANKVDTICSKLEDVEDEHKYNSLINKLESLDVETIEEINFRDVTKDKKYYFEGGYIQIINPIAYDLYL